MSQPQARARDLRRLIPGSNQRHQSLQEAVLAWCVLHRIPAVPVHTGPRVTPLGDGTFGLRGNRAQHGLADVLACLPPLGRLALLEMKTGRAHKKPAQVQLHQHFAQVGALSLTVRSVDDLNALLHQVARDRAIESLAGVRR